MKLGHQTPPLAVDPADAASQTFVERLGGRGAPDFIVVRKDANQNHSGGGAACEFDTTVNSRGLSIDGSGTFSGFKAGRTYYLQFQGRILDVGGGSVGFQWYDVTGAANIGVAALHKTMGSADDETSSPVAITIFSPEQDSTVELRIEVQADTGQIILGGASDYTGATIFEIAGPAISGPLEHIETITHSGAATQSVTFNNLNGEDDELYFLDVYWLPPAIASSNLELRPNGVSTNQNTVWGFFQDTSHSANESASLILARTANSTDLAMRSQIWFSARTSEYKQLTGTESVIRTGGNAAGRALMGLWNDNSTAITSLECRATDASGINAGTRISLYRLRSQNFPENAFPPGHLDGLQQTFNTVSTVDIAAGTCKDSTGRVDITVRSALTADITVVGVNGRDGGAETSSTWYALHVIYGPGKAVASLLSTSGTAPTLPAGYTHFKRVGWVRNNASSNIARWRLRGSGKTRYIWWDNMPGDFSAVLSAGGAATPTAVDCSGSAPPTATQLMFQYGYLNNSSNTRYFTLKTTGGTAENFTFRPGDISATLRNGSTPFIPCNSSQQIDYNVSAVSASNVLDLWVHAYMDEL